MILTAHVRDGRIVLDDPVSLPNGTALRLWVIVEDEVGPSRQPEAPASSPTLLDALSDVVGRVGDLPPDASSSVDSALYGGKRP